MLWLMMVDIFTLVSSPTGCHYRKRQMSKFRIRCSALSQIMSEPVTKAAREAGELSEGAKSFVHNLVRRYAYDYDDPELGSKEIKKGREMEGGAISLLSAVTGDLLSKNEQFFDNGWLCGTPDCWDSPTLYDTKCPWSIESFPMVQSMADSMARKSGYEMQMRGYMLLLNNAGIHLERAGVAYCLMETPTHLIPPWELESDIHGLPLFLEPEKRVTIAWFERDLEIEARIEKKCKAAQAYAETLMAQFKKEKAC